MDNPRNIDSRDIFNGFNTIRELRLEFSRGQQTSREVVVRPAAVAVMLSMQEGDKLVMVSQWRPGAYVAGAAPTLLEIVAGAINPGETPEEAAVREVREEAGCDVDSLVPICTIMPSPGFSSEICYLFFGRAAKLSPCVNGGVVEDGEFTQRVVIEFEHALHMLESGVITGAPTALALFWLASRRQLKRTKCEPHYYGIR